MSRFWRFWREDRNDHSVDNFVRKNYNALFFRILNVLTLNKIYIFHRVI